MAACMSSHMLTGTLSPIELTAHVMQQRPDARAAASPLPAGERSAHEVRRVRGLRSIERPEPPHPTPLPYGEREQTESAARLLLHRAAFAEAFHLVAIEPKLP